MKVNFSLFVLNFPVQIEKRKSVFHCFGTSCPNKKVKAKFSLFDVELLSQSTNVHFGAKTKSDDLIFHYSFWNFQSYSKGGNLYFTIRFGRGSQGQSFNFRFLHVPRKRIQVDFRSLHVPRKRIQSNFRFFTCQENENRSIFVFVTKKTSTCSIFVFFPACQKKYSWMCVFSLSKK